MVVVPLCACVGPASTNATWRGQLPQPLLSIALALMIMGIANVDVAAAKRDSRNKLTIIPGGEDGLL